ncbi:MAG TPA: UDP-2,3-diacylglucosamine diphosphatase LpxI [Candidatus Obscuribacterales bacterium]
MVSSLTHSEKQSQDTRRILAIVAGDGKLPPILAQSAKEKGYKVIAFCLSDDSQARMEPIADKVHRIAPGHLGRSAQLWLQEGVQDSVFIGKVHKVELLRQIHKIDLVALKELSRLPNFNDDTIQRGMADFVERHGIRVITQREFLRHLFPQVGVMTKREPTAAEYADIDFGMKIAREIASLDIGQTVVVRDRMVLAIEAIEGTDQAIRRGVELARGPVVVCKVAKPNQDQRFDIPALGMNTLNAMLGEKPGGVLAMAAGDTMMVDKEEMIRFADEKQMSIVAVSAKEGF